MTPYTVLVPIDGSDFSSQIIPYVSRLLIPREHTIVLLRVEEPLLDYSSWSSQSAEGESEGAVPSWESARDPELTAHPRLGSQTLEHLRARILTSMEPCRRYLDEAGFTVVCDVCFGDPVEQIVAYADEAEVDLVAMVTHGRSGLSRLAMGSTADGVLRQLHIPVLMVRPAVLPLRARRGRGRACLRSRRQTSTADTRTTSSWVSWAGAIVGSWLPCRGDAGTDALALAADRVSPILPSPLHGLLRRSILLLTITGRNRHTLHHPDQPTREGHTRVSMCSHRWRRHLRGGAPVRVKLHGWWHVRAMPR
jgi:nucleotide-binding universal stress UspA family protein